MLSVAEEEEDEGGEGGGLVEVEPKLGIGDRVDYDYVCIWFLVVVAAAPLLLPCMILLFQMNHVADCSRSMALFLCICVLVTIKLELRGER